MSQRCSNSFINHVDSADVVHVEEMNTKVKSIGPYILGDMIGKGMNHSLHRITKRRFWKSKRRCRFNISSKNRSKNNQ